MLQGNIKIMNKMEDIQKNQNNLWKWKYPFQEVPWPLASLVICWKDTIQHKAIFMPKICYNKRKSKGMKKVYRQMLGHIQISRSFVSVRVIWILFSCELQRNMICLHPWKPTIQVLEFRVLKGKGHTYDVDQKYDTKCTL